MNAPPQSPPLERYADAVRAHPRRVEETLLEWMDRIRGIVEQPAREREPGEEG